MTPEELKKTADKEAQKRAGGSTVTESFEEIIKKSPSVSEVNSIYDKQLESQKQQLQSAYDQSRAEAERAKNKIAPEYQGKANDLAVQYERNRRNFNQQALSRGLNTGAASQAALAQNSEYLKDFGALRGSEAEKLADAELNMAQLAEKYNASISKAVADNDLARAKAIFEAGQMEYKKRLARAETLAQYGDFSGYKEIYGEAQGDSMEKAWIAAHPDLAYNSGKITADQYFNITGAYPPGYSVPSYGGGGYSGGGGDYYYSPGSPTGDDKTPYAPKGSDGNSRKPKPIGSAWDRAPASQKQQYINEVVRPALKPITAPAVPGPKPAFRWPHS